MLEDIFAFFRTRLGRVRRTQLANPNARQLRIGLQQPMDIAFDELVGGAVLSRRAAGVGADCFIDVLVGSKVVSTSTLGAAPELRMMALPQTSRCESLL
jgi:hypothetical protein